MSEKEVVGIWGMTADKEAMRDGVRLELEKSGFKLAYLGPLNPRYLPTVARVYKPHQYSLKHFTDAERLRTVEELDLEVFLTCILKDWDNVRDPQGIFGEKGALVPFSKENARKLMQTLPMLYETLENFAKDSRNYREGDPEEDAKN